MSPKQHPTSRRAFLVGAFGLCLFASFSVAHAADSIAFDGLYKSFGVRGMEFSDRLAALRGKAVSIEGYMAPPLKPESNFFVLTREPVALCPFCQSDAEWPVDIVVIYLRSTAALVSAGDKVSVSGRLEVGSWIDPQTGFVSQIRIVDASYHRA